MELAAQFGIEFEVKASAPRNGELNAEDLSICLGNLLDNAIEAVAGLQKEKVIKVKLKADKGNLFINVTNPYLTAKKEKGKNHGEYPKMYYAIVGNVKVAVLRNGELIPVGSGHTVSVLAQEKYYSGDITREDALALLDENRIYNYIGRDHFRDIECYDTPIQLKKDDVVVLMSDGIYEGMEWKELEECLDRKSKCQKLAFDVIEHINRKTEDKDNAGIVLIKVGELL